MGECILQIGIEVDIIYVRLHVETEMSERYLQDIFKIPLRDMALGGGGGVGQRTHNDARTIGTSSESPGMY